MPARGANAEMTGRGLARGEADRLDGLPVEPVPPGATAGPVMFLPNVLDEADCKRLERTPLRGGFVEPLGLPALLGSVLDCADTLIQAFPESCAWSERMEASERTLTAWHALTWWATPENPNGPDGVYGWHRDSTPYCLQVLWYGGQFEGGEVDVSGGGTVSRVSVRPNSLVAFAPGRSAHRVLPVRSGRRLAVCLAAQIATTAAAHLSAWKVANPFAIAPASLIEGGKGSGAYQGGRDAGG